VTTYLAHSNIISTVSTVLSRDQLHLLGVALSAVNERFSPAYGAAAGNDAIHAMDCEPEFTHEIDPSRPAQLSVKPARPHPGCGN
jgi:hypothetical protein